jgi:hypothetical protein
MTEHERRTYPDVSDILARKREGRRSMARLSFGEKVARMEALRERLAPLKRARDARRATRAAKAERSGEGT